MTSLIVHPSSLTNELNLARIYCASGLPPCGDCIHCAASETGNFGPKRVNARHPTASLKGALGRPLRFTAAVSSFFEISHPTVAKIFCLTKCVNWSRRRASLAIASLREENSVRLWPTACRHSRRRKHFCLSTGLPPAASRNGSMQWPTGLLEVEETYPRGVRRHRRRRKCILDEARCGMAA